MRTGARDRGRRGLRGSIIQCRCGVLTNGKGSYAERCDASYGLRSVGRLGRIALLRGIGRLLGRVLLRIALLRILLRVATVSRLGLRGMINLLRRIALSDR